jgi:hypothetical protein
MNPHKWCFLSSLFIGVAACAAPAQPPARGGIQASDETTAATGISTWEEEVSGKWVTMSGYDDAGVLRGRVGAGAVDGPDGLEFRAAIDTPGQRANFRGKASEDSIKVMEDSFHDRPDALRVLKSAFADLQSSGGGQELTPGLTTETLLHPLDPQLACPGNLQLVGECAGAAVAVVGAIESLPACVSILGCVIPVTLGFAGGAAFNKCTGDGVACQTHH